jgi:hypothetical protein
MIKQYPLIATYTSLVFIQTSWEIHQTAGEECSSGILAAGADIGWVQTNYPFDTHNQFIFLKAFEFRQYTIFPQNQKIRHDCQKYITNSLSAHYFDKITSWRADKTHPTNWFRFTENDMNFCWKKWKHFKG